MQWRFCFDIFQFETMKPGSGLRAGGSHPRKAVVQAHSPCVLCVRLPVHCFLHCPGVFPRLDRVRGDVLPGWQCLLASEGLLVGMARFASLLSDKSCPKTVFQMHNNCRCRIHSCGDCMSETKPGSSFLFPVPATQLTERVQKKMSEFIECTLFFTPGKSATGSA